MTGHQPLPGHGVRTMSAQPPSAGDNRLHQTDALRGIAATLLAFVFHRYT
jgi:hypothetical protein